MDDFKSEKWTLEDGRRAERRVTEQKNADGQAERVIEFHIEDERPLRLQQRVVERSKPIVYERKVETVDPLTGNVVEQKVESIEPKARMMHLVEHSVAAAPTVSAQSVPADDCDCYVTKEEMIDTIVSAMKSFRDSSSPSEPVAPNSSFATQLNSLGLADEIGTRNADSATSNKMMICIVIIVAQLIGLGCLLYFM